MTTKTLYQVREYVGNKYSRVLGKKLRNRRAATKITKRLRSQGREVFASPMRVTL